MRRGAAWLACRAPPVAKDAPPGGQYYDEIEEDDADEEEDEEDTPQNRTKKLRSAVQRSAAPGRIADYYEFRKTLGALSFSLTHARALVRGHARRIGMSRGAERGRRRERARQSQPPPPIRSTPPPPPPELCPLTAHHSTHARLSTTQSPPPLFPHDSPPLSF